MTLVNQALSTENLIANIGVDTAENEPPKVSRKSGVRVAVQRGIEQLKRAADLHAGSVCSDQVLGPSFQNTKMLFKIQRSNLILTDTSSL